MTHFVRCRRRWLLIYAKPRFITTFYMLIERACCCRQIMLSNATASISIYAASSLGKFIAAVSHVEPRRIESVNDMTLASAILVLAKDIQFIAILRHRLAADAWRETSRFIVD